MELRHLRYFEALASTLNFTRAAERLHIAQPPLSRQIQQLEEELGVTLIDRSARPIALTRAGAFFFEQSTQILARIEELSRATKRLGHGQRRWVGVGFVPSMLYGALPKTIRGFMVSNPDIDVMLTELTSVQQVEALQAGRIDVGFGRVAIQSDGLVNRLIEEESLVAVVPAGGDLSGYQEVDLKTLSESTVIIYPSQPRPSFADHILAQFRARGCPAARIFETNGLQTAIGMVAAGVGVTLVPQSVKRLQRDDIVYLPLSDLGLTSAVFMITRAIDASPDVAALCDAVVRSVMSDLLATPEQAPEQTP
ncbi:LysR family transcriptional regulator [Aquabacterium sp.]|uniref:LysR family transcriptional regulator n=1 Tax=Aquabacterium sp. TaxID=1872578 RepID=UPI0025B95380|nr:LysR family transcriptional regulator [Aquabacterium sp.]